MNSKKKIAWLLLPILGILIFFYYRNSYSEFEPTLFRPETDSYESIKVDSVFYRNLTVVLAYYNEPYKVDESGGILVKRKLKSDKELIYNYTEKALDSGWLHSHKP